MSQDQVNGICLMDLEDILELHSVRGGLVRQHTPRIREEPGYTSLRDSIRDLGMTAPVAIRGNTLCHGYHRVAACQELGIERIRVVPFLQIP